jgi:ubiquitin carboxyl-terminal hydrolase 34
MATDAPSAPANHEHDHDHNHDHALEPHAAEQQVEMTIRSQPPSSSQPADGNEAGTTGPLAGDAALPLMEDSDTPEEPLVVEDDAPADSPPVIAIDDDYDAEEVMGDYATEYIHIERDEERYFAKFPFAPQYPDTYMGALRQIIVHFSGCRSTLFCFTVGPQLTLRQPPPLRALYFPRSRSGWIECLFVLLSGRGTFVTSPSSGTCSQTS